MDCAKPCAKRNGPFRLKLGMEIDDKSNYVISKNQLDWKPIGAMAAITVERFGVGSQIMPFGENMISSAHPN